MPNIEDEILKNKQYWDDDKRRAWVKSSGIQQRYPNYNFTNINNGFTDINAELIFQNNQVKDYYGGNFPSDTNGAPMNYSDRIQKYWSDHVSKTSIPGYNEMGINHPDYQSYVQISNDDKFINPYTGRHEEPSAKSTPTQSQEIQQSNDIPEFYYNGERLRVEVKDEDPLFAAYPYLKNLPQDKKDVEDIEQYVERNKDRYSLNDDFVSRDVQPFLDEAKEIARQQPYFKAFVSNPRDAYDDKWLPWDIKKWKEIALEYEATKNIAPDKAYDYVAGAVQDEIASHQTAGEKLWNSFGGFATSAGGSIGSFLGVCWGLVSSPVQDFDQYDDLNGWQEYWNSIFNNPVTQYSNDIITTGSFFPKDMEKAKQTGVSHVAVLQSREDERGIITRNTPYILLAQSGFTTGILASYAVGGGVVKGVTKGATKIAAKTISNAARLDKVVSRIQAAENIANRYVVPGVVAESEAAINGLQTQARVLEEGAQRVEQLYNQKINTELEQWSKRSSADVYDSAFDLAVMQYIADNYYPETTPDGHTEYYNKETGEILSNEEYNNIAQNVYDAKLQELQQKYEAGKEEALKKVESESLKAGNTDFLINSLINGVLHYTLKAGMQSQSVKDAISTTKVARAVKPLVQKAPKKAQLVASAVREPLAEGGEELAQNVSSTFSTTIATEHVDQFTSNALDPDMANTLAEENGHVLSTALRAAWHEVYSRESMQAFTLGALGSVMGAPALRGMRTYVDVDGNVHKTFKRVEGESVPAYVSRIAPWRFGAVANVKEKQRELTDADRRMETITQWLSDETNRDKFFSVTGTLNWANDAEIAAENGDEFDFRNSILGQRVAAASMLNAAQDTKEGQAMLSSIEEAANMTVGSDLANRYIEHVRQDVSSKFTDMTDEEIVENVKKNAKEQLELVEQVKKEGRRVDRIYGKTDTEVKNSLVYNRLKLADLERRSKSVNGRISQIQYTTQENEKDAAISNDKKQAIASLGGKKGITDAITETKDRLEDIEEALKGISDHKKNANTAEAIILDRQERDLKAERKRLNKQKKTLEKYTKEDTDVILSRRDIMALDSVTRGKLFRIAKAQEYENAHPKSKRVANTFSQAQLDIINSLYQELNKAYVTDTDHTLLDDLVDAGRIDSTIDYLHSLSASIAMDKNQYAAYYSAVKRKVALDNIRNSAKALSNVTSFSEFSQVLDTLLTRNQSDPEALITIVNTLKNNEFFRQYSSRKTFFDKVQNLLTTTKNGEKVIEGDNKLAYALLNFLQDKGLEYEDFDSILSLLQQNTSDTEGQMMNDFLQYINQEDWTKELQGARKELDLDTITAAFATYKQTVEQMHTEEQEHQRREQEVEVNTTATQEANTTTEQEEETTAGEEEVPTTTTANPITNAVTAEQEAARSEEEKSFKEDLKRLQDIDPVMADKIMQSYDSLARIPLLNDCIDEIQDKIRKSLQSALKAENPTISDFIDALNDAMSDLNQQPEVLYGQVTFKQSVQQIVEKSKEVDAVTPAPITVNETEEQEPTEPQQSSTQTMEPSNTTTQTSETSEEAQPIEDKSNAGFLETININYSKTRYPDGAIAKYLVQYGVEEYIKEHGLDPQVPVYFITDSTLTAAVAESTPAYNANVQSPIIAAVEDKNGPVEIDGKKYQPIGIMPSTGVVYSFGSARMEDIRSLRTDEEGVHLIKKEGVPVTTRIYGAGVTYAREAIESSEGNQMNPEFYLMPLYSEQEQQELADRGDTSVRHTKAYQSARKRFIQHLRSVKRGTRKALIYSVPNPRNNNNFDIPVFITPINETKQKYTGKTLAEVLLDDNTSIEDKKNFNRKTSLWVDTLVRELKATNFATLSKQGAPLVNLTKALNRYLNIPSASYRMSVDKKTKTATLSLQIGAESVTLATFNASSDMQQVAIEAMTNLIFDSSTKTYRTTARGDLFVKWEVDFGNLDHIEHPIDSQYSNAMDEVNNWVDDGIIYPIKTLQTPHVRSVTFEHPFNNDGGLVFADNTSQATATTPTNTASTAVSAVETNNGVIEGESGAVLEGNPEPISRETVVKQKINSITDAAKQVISDLKLKYSFKNNILTSSSTIRSLLNDKSDAPLYSYSVESNRLLEALANPHNNTVAKEYRDRAKVIKNSLALRGWKIIPTSIYLSAQHTEDPDITLVNRYFALAYNDNGDIMAVIPQMPQTGDLETDHFTGSYYESLIKEGSIWNFSEQYGVNISVVEEVSMTDLQNEGSKAVTETERSIQQKDIDILEAKPKPAESIQLDLFNSIAFDINPINTSDMTNKESVASTDTWANLSSEMKSMLGDIGLNEQSYNALSDEEKQEKRECIE